MLSISLSVLCIGIRIQLKGCVFNCVINRACLSFVLNCVLNCVRNCVHDNSVADVYIDCNIVFSKVFNIGG